MADEVDGGAVENQQDVTVDPQQYQRLENELKTLKAKLSEFRNTNITISKERDEKLLPELEQTKAELQEAKRQAMEAKGDIEGVYKSQIEELRNNNQKQIEALTARLTAEAQAREMAEQSSKKLLFTESVKKVALEKAAAEKEYLDYIVNDASKIFDIGADGELVPKDGQINTKTGDDWTFESWILDHRERKPRMYAGSTGGGAVGGSGGSGGMQTVTKTEWARKMGARDNTKFKEAFLNGKVKIEG